MFKNITLLFSVIMKNLKLVIRSPSSLLLLVVGPMLLILLIGFAFGGDQVHDINIGIVSHDHSQNYALVKIFQSQEVNVQQYSNLDECLWDIKTGLIEVCAELSEDFKATENEIAGKITFHYDNSRYNLVSYLKEYIQSKVAITSEQITLEAATGILGDIEEAVSFMQEAKTTIDSFIADIIKIRNDLAETKITLIEMKDEIDPLYEDALLLQKTYHENADDINSTVNQLHIKKAVVQQKINSINSIISFVNSDLEDTLLDEDVQNAIKSVPIIAVLIDFNDVEKLSKELIALQSRLTSLSTDLDKYDTSVQKTNQELSTRIDSTVELIKEVKEFIDVVGDKIDANILLLNNAIIELNQVKEKLDKNIAKFSGLDQSQAESLIKPITTKYEDILQDMTKINLVFPVVLVFIIMFISILLANINVLNEINSQSYFRNFLVPVKESIFVIGLFITNLIVVVFQIIVLLILAKFKFNIQIFPVIGSLSIVILLVTSIFILLGMSIAYFIKKQQTSILVSTFLALAAFLFSDVIFPPEVMPKLAAFFAQLNPMVVGERMIRKIIYHNLLLDYQIGDLIVLILFLVFMAVLVIIAARRNKKRS